MTAALRISEVSYRSGMAPSTLRYYEAIGLVSADRTAAGYRLYDESVLDRLAFIARAKALSCSLDEIRELVSEWAGGRCASVQDRLRELSLGKLAEAQARIEELKVFADDVRRVVAELGTHTPDGPCDAECGCLPRSASSESRVPKKGVATLTPAVACTLEAAEVPVRVREWALLLTHVTARSVIDGGLRLELDQDVPVQELARLVRAEQTCCRFFAFAITLDERGLGLEVRAPAGAEDLLIMLFDSPCCSTHHAVRPRREALADTSPAIGSSSSQERARAAAGGSP